jgi:EAL domain-containing protein (putative c-di-GMP-specific phosphodiesterase class I)
MGKNLKLRVVAEGVENVGQVELLKRLHCEFGQGLFFSHPATAKQAEQSLQQFSLLTQAAGN